MSLPEIIYQGSVKNLRGHVQDNFLFFEFSDRYSVFDWGAMPDQLADKGEALAHFGAMIFLFLKDKKSWVDWELPAGLCLDRVLSDLRERGARTHFIELEGNLLKVKKFNVIKPRWEEQNWNYTVYGKRPTGCLVPLEVIFRHGVPEGSSLIGRLGKNLAYQRELGIDSDSIQVGSRFKYPLIEFSTKLEPEDRFLSYAEAREISGMSESEFFFLKDLATLFSVRLKDLFAQMDMELWDGKFEFAFTPSVDSSSSSDRGFDLIDSIGPDELRLLDKGAHVSKEALRQHYLTTPWYGDVKRAKEEAKKKEDKDWKKYCLTSPPVIPKHLKESVEDTYRMITNKLALTLGEAKVF